MDAPSCCVSSRKGEYPLRRHRAPILAFRGASVLDCVQQAAGPQPPPMRAPRNGPPRPEAILEGKRIGDQRRQNAGVKITKNVSNSSRPASIAVASSQVSKSDRLA